MIKVKLKSKRVLKRMAEKDVRILGMPVHYCLTDYPTGVMFVVNEPPRLHPVIPSPVAPHFSEWSVPKQYIGKVKRYPA